MVRTFNLGLINLGFHSAMRTMFYKTQYDANHCFLMTCRVGKTLD